MSYRHYISNGDVRIRFDAQPSADVRRILKASGFRWSPREGVWWRRRVSGAADVLTAIDKQLHKESGAPDGKCWKCGEPGHFRSYGAATPVYCDACEAENRQAREVRDFRPDPIDMAYEDDCARRCGL